MFNVVYLMVDALAVLISTTYMLYTPSISEMVFNGKVSCGRCSSPSHSFLYALYTASLSENVFNELISCARCFSRSHQYSIFVIYTFYE